MSNVVDMQAFREEKPETNRRHHVIPLAEGIHARAPIVSRAMLLGLNAIKNEEPAAARDAENSFKTPEELEAQNARSFGSPALHVVPEPAPAEAPPVISVAETTDDSAQAQVYSLDAARRRVEASRGDHAEQTFEQARTHAGALVIDLAEKRAAYAQQAAQELRASEITNSLDEMGYKAS